MTPESILDIAINKRTPAERAAFLDGACGNDPKLRQEMEALVQAHLSGTPFMQQPVMEQTAAWGPQNGHAAARHESEQIGPYKLREKLGEGGMGTVYVADQKEPVQRRVAIKLIKGGADSRALMARFEQERQALALMDHPNIAKVLDAGVFRNTPYFVMELIKGVPITRYCDEAKLTPRERLELFIPVCHAVQHAHQKGIIHRDLKPSNILIGLYDGKPIPKIIDFGVAKATGSRLTEQSIYTEVGSLIGTLEYMSPEQAELNNLDIDTRTDIYALGIILYELLTGTVPFSQKEFAQAGMVKMLLMIKEVEPPKPSTKLSSSGSLPSVAATRKMEPKKLTKLIKGDLDWIIMKTLEKERNRRYETANALAADINRYLNNEMVLAARPSMTYRFRKFIRRNKLAAMATLIVLTTLVATALLQTWSLLRAIDAEKLAVQEAGDKAVALMQAVEERKEKETALTAVVKERDARDEALKKSDGLRLAAEATLVRNSNPGLSMLLGLEAVKRLPHHLTYDALFGAASECRELRNIPVTNHTAKIIRISPDKKRMLTAGETYDKQGFNHGVVVVWDVATLQPIQTWNGLCTRVRDVSWSPDGSKFAVIPSGNMTVYFEYAPERKQVRFTDKLVHVVDANTGKNLCRLQRHEETIETVQFSPDGKKLVTASTDGNAKVWDAQSGKLLHTLQCGEHSLHSATFSPDSKLILTLASNRTPINRPRRGDVKTTFSVVDEPTPRVKEKEEGPEDPEDISTYGKVSGYSSGGGGWSSGSMSNPIARIWDAETGTERVSLKKKVPNLVDALLQRNRVNCSTISGWFTSDSRQAVIALNVDYRHLVLNYWDTTTGGFEKAEDSFLSGTIVASNSDHTQIAVGYPQGLVKLWDTQTKKENSHQEKHDAVIQKFFYSPDGKYLLIACAKDQTDSWSATNLDVVNASTGATIARLRGHAGFEEAAFHPDGKHLISVGGGTLRLWSLEPIQPVTRMLPTLAPVQTEAHMSQSGSIGAMTVSRTFRTGRRVVAMEFSPEGNQIFIGNDDETASVWDIHTGKHQASTKAALGGLATQVMFHAPGTVSFAEDHSLWWSAMSRSRDELRRSSFFLWNWQSGPERKFLKNQSFGIRHFQWSADRKRLLLVSNGSIIDAKGGQITQYGKQYIGQGCTGEVSIWDAPSGTRLCVLPELAARDSLPCYCDNDESILLCADNESYIGVYDAVTGKLKRKYDAKSVHGGSYRHAVLTHDGTTLIGRKNAHNSPIFFWHSTTGEVRGKTDVPMSNGTYYLFELSSDCRTLAVGADSVAVLIDVTTGKLTHELRGHEDLIRCMKFSPDSRYLLTGSDDKSATLWNTETGKIVHVYKDHPDAVMNIAWSPTGMHLATQSTDQFIRIWPLKLIPLLEQRIQREFTLFERQRYELK